MNQWNKIYKKPKEYKYYDLLEPHLDMAKVVKHFKKRNVKKVLDLGCGLGRNLFYLLEQGFDVSGIDLAKEGIEQIKKRVKKVNDQAKNKIIDVDLKVGDVFSNLPYSDNSFDAIVSVQVLQHSNQEGIKKAISEIKRILKPEGLLFVTVCGRYSKGKIRYFLVKTAKQIAPNTYVPTKGNECGLVHFIYNKKILLKHYSDFKLIELWRDDKDYYCFLGEK